MTIEIRKPELEKLVQEEFVSGHFQSVDDLLTEALRALRERNAMTLSGVIRRRSAEERRDFHRRVTSDRDV